MLYVTINKHMLILFSNVLTYLGRMVYFLYKIIRMLSRDTRKPCLHQMWLNSSVSVKSWSVKKNRAMLIANKSNRKSAPKIKTRTQQL